MDIIFNIPHPPGRKSALSDRFNGFADVVYRFSDECCKIGS
jgi:hypothetical protein